MSLDLEYVDCNLCGNSKTKIYSKVSYNDYLKRRPELNTDNDPIVKDEQLLKHRFSMVKCENCGFIYINPRLSQKSLADLYRQEYFSYYSEKALGEKKNREKTFNVEISELENIVSHLGLNKKILDVGCGGGYFLDLLDDVWEKYGADINSAAVDFGKKNFGLNILQGDLKSVRFEDNCFDVIKMRGTIEHLPDPAEELREVYRILKKGGVLAINTPNIGSICGKIYREKFRMVCPTHHIYYFSAKTLSEMLKKIGFKVYKKSYHYFNTPYFKWDDFFKILLDVLSFRVFRNPDAVSPAFYGNVIDIYVTK